MPLGNSVEERFKQQYPHMLKTRPTTQPELSLNFNPENPSQPAEVPNILPMIKTEGRKRESTAVDEALSKKLGKEALLRLKAMEYTLELLGRSVVVSPEKIQEIYDIFYKNINGTKKRQEVRQRSIR